MCGIAGFWSVVPPERHVLPVFTDMLAHRGPDGSGYLTADGGRLGLGHRRLAIIDPGAGAQQPMLSADRRYALVFNGEIFNFLEIRDELVKRGHRFRTDSDSEVLLAAFAAWGHDCLNRLNGMWAFAIWDDLEKSLFLARDRFGIKPLYLLHATNGFAFASEPKAFAALPFGSGGRGGAPAIRNLGHVTILTPGTYARMAGPGGHLVTEAWWHPLDHIRMDVVPYAAQVEEFRDLLFDACRIRLRSDVTLGTAISGGLDSSAVLAAVNALGTDAVVRRPTDWSRAFHARLQGTAHDELDYASAACEAAGVRPIIVDILDRCRPDDVDRYLYLTEGMPFTNLPAWYLYRTMREQGARVSLDGQGADEIAAGYAADARRALMLEGSWLRRPRRTLDMVRTTRDLLCGSPYYEMQSAELYLLPFRIASHRRQLRFVVPPDARDPATVAQASSLPPLNAVLFLAVNQGIRSLLNRYDVLSMSSGLEIRMPFLDWRLVSYALGLPATSLLGGGFTKRVLRDAMTDYLPELVTRRKPKLQFQGPVKDLLTGPLRPWIEAHPSYRQQVNDAERRRASPHQWRSVGDAIVREWTFESYPGLVHSEVGRLVAVHRADPDQALRHTVCLT